MEGGITKRPITCQGPMELRKYGLSYTRFRVNFCGQSVLQLHSHFNSVAYASLYRSVCYFLDPWVHLRKKLSQTLVYMDDTVWEYIITLNPTFPVLLSLEVSVPLQVHLKSTRCILVSS